MFQHSFFPTPTSIPASSLLSLLHTFTCIMPLFLLPIISVQLNTESILSHNLVPQFLDYVSSSYLIFLFSQQFGLPMSISPSDGNRGPDANSKQHPQCVNVLHSFDAARCLRLVTRPPCISIS